MPFKSIAGCYLALGSCHMNDIEMVQLLHLRYKTHQIRKKEVRSTLSMPVILNATYALLSCNSL